MQRRLIFRLVKKCGAGVGLVRKRFWMWSYLVRKVEELEEDGFAEKKATLVAGLRPCGWNDVNSRDASRV